MKLKIEHSYAQINELKIISNTTIDMVENSFLNYLNKECQTLNLEGLNIFIDSLHFGGWFSSKTNVLVIEPKKSKLKNQRAYFFVTNNGKMYNFFLYRCMEPKYFSKLNDKIQNQRLEFMQTKLGSIEEQHEFVVFEKMVLYLFRESMNKLTN